MSLWTLRRAVSTLWHLLYADWWFSRSWFLDKWAFSLLNTTFSVTFETCSILGDNYSYHYSPMFASLVQAWPQLSWSCLGSCHWQETYLWSWLLGPLVQTVSWPGSWAGDLESKSLVGRFLLSLPPPPQRLVLELTRKNPGKVQGSYLLMMSQDRHLDVAYRLSSSQFCQWNMRRSCPPSVLRMSELGVWNCFLCIRLFVIWNNAFSYSGLLHMTVFCHVIKFNHLAAGSSFWRSEQWYQAAGVLHLEHRHIQRRIHW